MNRQIKLKINTVILIFFFSALYFWINRFIKLPSGQLLGITWNFSQIPTMLFGLIQWIILVNYLQYFITKKNISQLNVAVLMIFLLDSIIIILNKTSEPSAFLSHAYSVSHNFIKFFASGLIAVIASVYLRFTINPNKTYIPEKESTSTKFDNANYKPIPKYWKMGFRVVFVIMSLCSIMFLAIAKYKLAGFTFFAALSGIGFQLRWNVLRFQKINPTLIYVSYVFSWILAIWGILFDFFTGFLFLTSGFLILISTHAGKDDSPVKLLLVILNLLLAALALIFHFMFSVGYKG